MANSASMNTGNMPRSLQYGVDKFFTHFDKEFPIVGDSLFTKVSTDKGFYEVVQLAGMGLAAVQGESAPITYDSIDQDYVYSWPVYTYEKSARISKNAIKDNVYHDQLSMMVKCIMKGLKHNRDYQMVKILNNAFSSAATDLGGDGVALCSTQHPIQAGGVNSNRLATDLDLSEDAVEQMVLLVDEFLTPDGLRAEYRTKKLVVPNALKFEACRILKTKGQTGNNFNDVNALYQRGDIEDYVVWKRLSDTDAWYLTTDGENGLLMATRQGIEKNTFNDPYTYDVIVSANERYRCFFGDYRCIAGTQGA